MAKKKNQEDEVLVDVGESISKVESYIEENRKSLTFIAGGLIVIIVAYFAVDIFYQQPREQTGQEEIYKAQQFFEMDSLNLALNGNGQDLGFVDIADSYSGTKAGNLANYYAGVSYLNLGQFENAISYLDAFSSDDPILSVIAQGSIGDAFMEINQPKEALEYYAKSVSGKENDLVVPFYLKKAAVVAEEQGNLDDALKYLNRIKSKFKESPQAIDVDKYISRVETKKGA